MIFDRVSRAVATVEGAESFRAVADGIGKEKSVLYGRTSRISLIMPIFEFFLPCSTGAGDCDMAMQLVLKFQDAVVSVAKLKVVIE